AARSAANRATLIPTELVVRLKPGAKIEDWARLVGAKVTGRIDSLNAYRLEFETEAAANAAREQLSASSDVESVDNNYSISRPSVPEQASGQSVPPPLKLQLNPTSGDGRVVVGLIDTGIQSLGTDLDKFILETIKLAGDGALNSSSPTHSTTMAGTILRSLQEITKGKTSVQILPIDVYGANVNTTTFSVSQGIVLAVNKGATILNLSLGSAGDDALLRSIIADISSRNIPIFAAAGNEPVATPVYPAAYPGVQAVTAVDHGQIAPYANRGSFISYGVPGTSIVYFNNRPYQIIGTSAASAAAAGFAAGYMDSTHSTAAQMQSFMRNNFGVTITPR
ncbi:MAG TPA: S8 family serine peptidase, partial [Clostridia bacterium]|nr:S8 family serine peptidase [Clostridia bacterium]